MIIIVLNDDNDNNKYGSFEEGSRFGSSAAHLGSHETQS